jgi:predicted transcriptional regulator
MKKLKVKGIVYSIEKDKVIEVIGTTVFDGTEAFKLTQKQFTKLYGKKFKKFKGVNNER